MPRTRIFSDPQSILQRILILQMHNDRSAFKIEPQVDTVNDRKAASLVFLADERGVVVVLTIGGMTDQLPSGRVSFLFPVSNY